MGLLDIFKASENERLKRELSEAQGQLAALQSQYNSLQASIPQEQKDFEAMRAQTVAFREECGRLDAVRGQIHTNIERMKADIDVLKNDIVVRKSALDKLISNTQKVQQLYEQFKAAVKGYEKSPDNGLQTVQIPDELLPVIEVNLNCMNVRDLRTRYRQKQRDIQKVFKRYEGRYTTKGNSAIYKLMVIAMEAELQNILSTLSYGKLDDAEASVKAITDRYYEVAVEGNQSIAPTMKSFIAEIEVLFIDTVNIEYEYYVKREQQREEQRALREQMRQEAEERKALEAERKKIEREESKYLNEIEQLNDKMKDTTNTDMLQKLQARIAELQSQIDDVQKKKDDIVKLQNGKAGYVYVISNLGSFGEDVFKIGMTRRLEPMDRIHELGSASVPFEFDVHSFIFSNDAVTLEAALHRELNQKRVNKVNLRKEFFRVSIDELEQLVLQHDPTAEFNRTMLAEQYHQSLNRDEVVPEFDDSDSDAEDTDDE